MSEQNQATQVADRTATSVAQPKPWNMTPSNMGEAMKYAEMLANSDLVPKDYKGKAGNVIIAVQMGQEVGLSPIQAVQNIAVINGHPSIWGDALPALAKRNPDYEYLHTEWDEDRMVATCRGKRKGEPEEVQTFSWTDAERAGLAKKDTYKNYPQRMCMIRARSWVIRNVFPDSLKGLYVAEEALDIPADDFHVVPTDADLEAAGEVLPTHGMDGLAQRMADNAGPEDAEVVETIDDGGNEVAVDGETGEIVADIDGLKLKMDEAADISELERIGLEFNALPHGEQRDALRKHYRVALDRLVTAMAEGSGDDGEQKGTAAGDTSDT